MSLNQKNAIVAFILLAPLMFSWEEAWAADNSKSPGKVDAITICYAAADLCNRSCELAALTGPAYLNCERSCAASLDACLPHKNKASLGNSGNSKNEAKKTRKNRKLFSPN